MNCQVRITLDCIQCNEGKIFLLFCLCNIDGLDIFTAFKAMNDITQSILLTFQTSHFTYFITSHMSRISQFNHPITPIQVHALICVAEAKVHALKWIQIHNFLEVRKIRVLRIYLCSSIWRVVLDILVKFSLLLEEYKRKETYKHAAIFQTCHQAGRVLVRICYFIV